MISTTVPSLQTYKVVAVLAMMQVCAAPLKPPTAFPNVFLLPAVRGSNRAHAHGLHLGFIALDPDLLALVGYDSSDEDSHNICACVCVWYVLW